MKKFYSLLAVAFLLYCLVDTVWSHGTRWEFGRYCMPRTLVAADGRSYLDGEPIPDLILALIRSDVEEEVMLTEMCVLSASLAWLGYEIRRFHRTAIEYRAVIGREFKWK